MSVAVGADIESLCSKCGDVWHVVVAMVDGKVAKVECKECHGVHRYRDPKGKAKAAPKRTSKAGAGKKAPAPKVPVVEANPDRPPRPYRTTDTYEPGDRVQHATFGDGVVQAVVGPGKVEILFADGERRLLACAKPAPSLGRAPRRRFETEN
ncbi:MAG: hypothetical protein D6689_07805 [Deltaproteobacteria bacterium]|nr:MAG: hypothetical protein D6689_07805 [Deltaproteobacteria bacterium]